MSKALKDRASYPSAIAIPDSVDELTGSSLTSALSALNQRTVSILSGSVNNFRILKTVDGAVQRDTIALPNCSVADSNGKTVVTGGVGPQGVSGLAGPGGVAGTRGVDGYPGAPWVGIPGVPGVQGPPGPQGAAVIDTIFSNGIQKPSRTNLVCTGSGVCCYDEPGRVLYYSWGDSWDLAYNNYDVNGCEVWRKVQSAPYPDATGYTPTSFTTNGDGQYLFVGRYWTLRNSAKGHMSYLYPGTQKTVNPNRPYYFCDADWFAYATQDGVFTATNRTALWATAPLSSMSKQFTINRDGGAWFYYTFAPFGNPVSVLKNKIMCVFPAYLGEGAVWGIEHSPDPTRFSVLVASDRYGAQYRTKVTLMFAGVEYSTTIVVADVGHYEVLGDAYLMIENPSSVVFNFTYGKLDGQSFGNVFGTLGPKTAPLCFGEFSDANMRMVTAMCKGGISQRPAFPDLYYKPR